MMVRTRDLEHYHRDQRRLRAHAQPSFEQQQAPQSSFEQQQAPPPRRDDLDQLAALYHGPGNINRERKALQSGRNARHVAPQPESTAHYVAPQPESNQNAYARDLAQQIKEKELRKQRERERRREEDERYRLSMQAYNPFGRGGAGAPIRDQYGRVCADLRKVPGTERTEAMHAGDPPSPYSVRRMEQQQPVQQVQQVQQQHPNPAGDRARLHVQAPRWQPQISQAPATSQDVEDVRHVRYSFQRMQPEEQAEYSERQRKMRDIQDSLQQQIDLKRKRVALEKEELQRQERAEEERLQRERAELAAAYERDHNRPKAPTTQDLGGGGGGGLAVVTKPDVILESVPQRPLRSAPSPGVGALPSARSSAGASHAGIGALAAEHSALATEMKRQEEQMRKLRRELEQVRSERDSLLSGERRQHHLAAAGKLVSQSKMIYDENVGSGALSPPRRLNRDAMDGADAVSLDRRHGAPQQDIWGAGEATGDQLDELLLDFVHRRRQWS